MLMYLWVGDLVIKWVCVCVGVCVLLQRQPTPSPRAGGDKTCAIGPRHLWADTGLRRLRAEPRGISVFNKKDTHSMLKLMLITPSSLSQSMMRLHRRMALYHYIHMTSFFSFSSQCLIRIISFNAKRIYKSHNKGFLPQRLCVCVCVGKGRVGEQCCKQCI